MIHTIAQLVIYGVVLGSILALGAIGVSLIYGILRFAHFAHGDLMTVGAYAAFFGVTALHLPLAVAFVLAAVIAAGVALGLDRLIYRRLRASSPIIMLISTFGTALMLRSLVQLVWGSSNHVYYSGIQRAYVLFKLRILPNSVVVVAVAVGLVLLVHLFLRYSKMGKAMRAMSDNMDLAQVTGINTELVIVWTWIIAAGLAAAAGILLGLSTLLNPTMGWDLLLPIFAAAILGGIGSIYGAILGGFVIGIAEQLSTLVIDPGYKPAVAFGIMVVILLVRPSGIIAEAEA